MRSNMMVIGGGVRDPNIQHLSKYLDNQDIPHLKICHGNDPEIELSADISKGEIRWNKKWIKMSSAFIRHDVFSFLESGDFEYEGIAQAWYGTLQGMAYSNDDTKIFNRNLNLRSLSKVYILSIAEKFEITIPRSIITNSYAELKRMSSLESCIAKPVVSGAYCIELHRFLDSATWPEDTSPMPAFVQPKLEYPEFRVFIIGKTPLAFIIKSTQTDYRTDHRAHIQHIGSGIDFKLPVNQLVRLADHLNLDFCAFDLKTEEDKVVMLEVNSSPMFSGYDQVSDGAICNQICKFLTN